MFDLILSAPALYGVFKDGDRKIVKNLPRILSNTILITLPLKFNFPLN